MTPQTCECGDRLVSVAKDANREPVPELNAICAKDAARYVALYGGRVVELEPINPRWLAWERAGAPKPSADFPRALAFILWIGEQWQAFERASKQPRGADRSLWRHDNAEAFDRWLAALHPAAPCGALPQGR